MWNSAQQRGYRDAEYRDAERHHEAHKLKMAGRTAIHRRKMSAPTTWLMESELIHGTVLDFGCGKGDDVLHLKENDFDVVGYDPNHRPDVSPLGEEYDTVICNYVLNVVRKLDEALIMRELRDLLKPGGTAYITVRRDVKKEGVTRIGTYQRNVLLDLPIVRQCAGYCIYKLENNA